jgi:hypothetical protein
MATTQAFRQALHVPRTDPAIGEGVSATTAGVEYQTGWRPSGGGGSSLTPTDMLNAIKTVDGPSSGLDADLLDGQHAAAFSPVAHTHPTGDVTGLDAALAGKAPTAHSHAQSDVTGLPAALSAKLDASAYTANDVLTKIKTVDGVGSGLDADTLDGQSSAAFAAAAHNHPTSEITGLDTALAGKLNSSAYTAADVLAKLLTVDGTGSGLDADTLDGQSSAAFALATALAAAPVVPAVGGAIDTQDWDNLAQTGWHGQLLGTANAHHPFAGQYFFCFNIVFSASNILQIAFPYSLGASIAKGIYYRGRFSGTWSNWSNMFAIDTVTGLLNVGSFTTTGDIVVAANAATASLILSKAESTTGAQVGIRMTISGNSAAIRSSSNVATSVPHAYYYNTNGQVGSVATSGTGTTFATTSDERLKDIGGGYDPAEAIAIIRADPVKAFTWKETGEQAIGWIAQQSYAVDEKLAVPPQMGADGRQLEEDDRWGIDYGQRTPYLWAALSNALDRIEALEAKLSMTDPKPTGKKTAR